LFAAPMRRASSDCVIPSDRRNLAMRRATSDGKVSMGEYDSGGANRL
jgi:hypothetical protein